MRSLNCYLKMHLLSRTPEHFPCTDLESAQTRSSALSRSFTVPARIRKKSGSSTALLAEPSIKKRVATAPATSAQPPQLPPLPHSPPLERVDSQGTAHIDAFETARSFGSQDVGLSVVNTISTTATTGSGERERGGKLSKVQFTSSGARGGSKADVLLAEMGEGLDETDREGVRVLMQRYGLDLKRRRGEAVADVAGKLLWGNVVVALARVERHGLVLEAEGKKAGSAPIDERWDMIHDDVVRYTKAMKSYEYWATSKISAEINPTNLPPNYHTYAQTLALLDIASNTTNPETKALLSTLSKNLLNSHHEWSSSHSPFARSPRWKILLEILFLAIFAGMLLIVPMVIMVMHPSKASRIVTTCIFTAVVGLGLALFGRGLAVREVVLGTVGYAAILVILVGRE